MARYHPWSPGGLLQRLQLRQTIHASVWGLASGGDFGIQLIVGDWPQRGAHIVCLHCYRQTFTFCLLLLNEIFNCIHQYQNITLKENYVIVCIWLHKVELKLKLCFYLYLETSLNIITQKKIVNIVDYNKQRVKSEGGAKWRPLSSVN